MSMQKVFDLACMFYNFHDLSPLGGSNLRMRAAGYVHDSMHTYLGLGVELADEVEVTLYQLALILPRDKWEQYRETIREEDFFPGDEVCNLAWDTAQVAPEWVKDMNKKYPVTLIE
jgi:hypothetical protein